MNNKLRILVYGAGAIGGSIGGWIAQSYPEITLLARGKHAKTMKSEGLLLHSSKNPISNRIKVHVLEELKADIEFDAVLLTVKNYQLEDAAKDITEKLGSEVLVVALQNGVDNQKVLPKYFKNIIYGVVCYNAWIMKPGHIIYQSKGPVILGAISKQLDSYITDINSIFSKNFSSSITNRIQDAVHCKIVLNLTNALFTLTGLNVVENIDYPSLAFLTAQVLNEGIDIIKASGYKEHKLGSLPSWTTIRFTKLVPTFLRTAVFKRKAKHSVVNSMMQDVFHRKRSQTELESLNGYIIELANKYNIEAPFNRGLYELAKKQFAQQPFKPVDPKKIIEYSIELFS